MGDLLTVCDLKKRIGDVQVLGGVSAEICEGEVTAFIGPNGAGKTSLFHAITGNLPLDSGRVELDGSEITGASPWEVARAGVGRVFQDVRVFRQLTAVENVMAALHSERDKNVLGMFRGGAEQMGAQARKLIEKVGIEGDPDGNAGDLSFGNQKLLAFARLMAGRYRAVLLDEPTAGVSPAMVARLIGLIRKLANAEGRAVALVEHDMKFISDVADRVYVLREGRVFDSGSAAEVLKKPEVKELCLGL